MPFAIIISMQANRTVVLALDALHEEMLELDEMSETRRLFEASRSGRLESVKPPMTSAAFTSFQTGKRPVNHGISSFLHIDEDEDGLRSRPFDGTDLQEPTLYEYLDREGIDCFLLNLPYTYPPRIDGDVVSSWLTPAEDIEEYFHPTDLPERYPSLEEYVPSVSAGAGTVEGLRDLQRMAERRCAVIREVIEANDHEFLFFLIRATDVLQHAAYRQLFGDEPEDEKGQIARSVLETVDETVGWVDEATEGDDLLLFSDHGFTDYSKTFSVNDWLEATGYLNRDEDGIDPIGSAPDDPTAESAGSGPRLPDAMRRMVVPLRNTPIAGLLRRGRDVLERGGIEVAPVNRIGLGETDAYARYDGELGIHVTDDASPETLERIRSELDSNPHVEVLPALEGAYSDRFPNLFVIGDRAWPTTDDTLDEVVVDHPKPYHDMNGIVAARGPDVESGTVEGCLYDLAPTILRLFDVGIPTDMDGDPLSGIGPRGSAAPVDPMTAVEISNGTTDRGVVENRLEDLGYL